jgi:WhiB family redox-sensing transcriptional regulator
VVNRDDSPDYQETAVWLDRWQQVPADVLAAVVVDQGLCWWGLWPPQEPDWDDERDLAARLCAGCPVIGQCLELDLRTAGANTTGVWGAMCEDDRRALHPIWRRRRHQHDRPDQEGGPTP